MAARFGTLAEGSGLSNKDIDPTSAASGNGDTTGLSAVGGHTRTRANERAIAGHDTARLYDQPARRAAFSPDDSKLSGIVGKGALSDGYNTLAVGLIEFQ